jgi:Nucleoside 2-deoxyribosyltransferase like
MYLNNTDKILLISKTINIKIMCLIITGISIGLILSILYYLLKRKKNNEIEVFLGGTCNDSNWREELIPLLKIKYFNPVVEDWNETILKIEYEKKKTCDYILYTITPKFDGLYSIAEVVDDSNKRSKKVIFCILKRDEDGQFSTWQLKSLKLVENMIKNNGSYVFYSLNEIASFLNKVN